MKVLTQLFFLFTTLVAAESTGIRKSCPCDDPLMCEPLQGPPVTATGELMGFIGDSSFRYEQYMNWTWVTTIAWGDDNLTCIAHQHGVRSVMAAPSIDLLALDSDSARSAWAHAALDSIQANFRDGIVFDYEQPANGTLASRYAKLITTTARVFRTNASTGVQYQISTCVPWSPANIDGRDYPWQEIAEASDLLYVMDYDTRSQVATEGFCLAGPDAPYEGMVQAMAQWETVVGSDGLRRIILGVPWYGYRYECVPGTRWDSKYCPIAEVPFRGVNCSDAAGREIGYNNILNSVRPVTPTWRGESRSPFFNAVEDGTVVQYWFDDADSLRRKFRWAKSKGVAGVGPFAFQYIAGCEAHDAVQMWSAFDSFFDGAASSTLSREKTRNQVKLLNPHIDSKRKL